MIRLVRLALRLPYIWFCQNKPSTQRFNRTALRGHAHMGVVIEHLFRQVARNALHSGVGNPGFPHLRDALVPEIMEPKPRKRFGRTPARCLWIGPGWGAMLFDKARQIFP